LQQAEIISGTLGLGENKINCLRMGNGKKLLITFHGFGNSAEQFAVFLPFLKDEYTLVSIDLPGHGKTEWVSKYMLPKDLMALVQGIKNDFGVERFSLMGFSLGARVVLNILGLQPAWIDSVVLLAPDGLKKDFWYNFATKNILGKLIFNHALRKPESWLKRLQFLKKLRLVDESRYKFASSHMLNKEVNARVAFVWPVMSKLSPIIPIVKYNIKKYKIPVTIFMGQYDRVFDSHLGGKFSKGLKTAELHILNCGHNILKPEFVEQIVKEGRLK